MIQFIAQSMAYLMLITAGFNVTVPTGITAESPVAITLTVPHSPQNDVACAGVNDQNSYTGFPNSFSAFVCWNVNLSDFPDIAEQFEQVFAPLSAGTYYVGAVLYLKPAYAGAKRSEPRVLPLVPFTVAEAK